MASARRLVFLLLVALPALTLVGGPQPVAATPVAATGCGVERWPVKVLSDADAGRIDLAPVATTVAELARLAPPAAPDGPRRAPTEFATFVISAGLVAAALEDDGDIHLVVADPAEPAATLIVEFPDPACTLDTAPALRARMAAARAAFAAAEGQPPAGRFVPLGGIARITGVAFFDRLHGQRGAAPNGIELHPALDFALAAENDQCFPQTGHCIRGRFADYWAAHGGLEQQGMPLTDEFNEVNPTNGQPYRTQYFERARFEYHPENQPPFDVLLGLLGREQFLVKYPAGAPAGIPPDTGCDVAALPAGTRCINQQFGQYYLGHGALAQQGYAIADAFYEASPTNGQTYLVQYFERARFEYHPENAGSPYVILLGLLGREQFLAKYPDGPPPMGSPPPASGGYQLTAAVSNSTPAPYSTVTVAAVLTNNGLGVAGATLATTWHYKTTTVGCTGGPSGGDGRISCARSIGGATVGYTVVIDVVVTYQGRSFTASTSFTPR